MNDIDRISDPDYLPTDRDILHAHSSSTDICEIEIEGGRFIYRILDISGPRLDHKQLVNVINSMHAIIFLVSLSSYSESLPGEKNGVRIVPAEALLEKLTLQEQNERVDFPL